MAPRRRVLTFGRVCEPNRQLVKAPPTMGRWTKSPNNLAKLYLAAETRLGARRNNVVGANNFVVGIA
jgi:hypothetical protein